MNVASQNAYKCVRKDAECELNETPEWTWKTIG